MHRALLKAGAAPRPPWPPRNHFYKEEQKGTIDYKGYIPGRFAARQLGMERRVAPSGSAFTRREFVAHYHGSKEWDAADPHKHDESEKHLLTISFAWDGVIKSVGSSFIGVSPEFEMALYTLMFLCGEEENDVEIGGYKIRITCFSMGHKPGRAGKGGKGSGKGGKGGKGKGKGGKGKGSSAMSLLPPSQRKAAEAAAHVHVDHDGLMIGTCFPKCL